MKEHNDNQSIIELYKLAVDMADKISHRRGITNHFYLTLELAIFTGALTLYTKEI